MMNFGEADAQMDGRVLAGFPEPRGVLFPDEPARLMLEPVQRARQDRSGLVPNDLLMMLEAHAKEAV